MNKKSLLFTFLGILGGVGIFVIVIIFRRNTKEGEGDSTEMAEKSNISANTEGMKDVSEVVPVKQSTFLLTENPSFPTTAKPPTSSSDVAKGFNPTPQLLTLVAPSSSKPSTLTNSPPEPSSGNSTQSSSSNLPPTGSSSLVTNTNVTTPSSLPASSSPTPINQSNPSTSTTTTSSTTTITPNIKSSSSSTKPSSSYTKLTIVEDMLTSLPNQKQAGILRLLLKKESSSSALSASDKQALVVIIVDLVTAVIEELTNTIEKAVSAKSLDLFKSANEYFPTLQQLQQTQTELGMPVAVLENFDVFVHVVFIQKMYNMMDSFGTEDLSPEKIRKAFAYLKEFLNFAKSANIRDLKKFEEAFANAARTCIVGKTESFIMKQISLNCRAGSEAKLLEVRALITEVNLGSAIPANIFDNLEEKYRDYFEPFMGRILVECNPPRPVINKTGNLCFAIATLQAFATFFSSFNPYKMDMSMEDSATIFVKILRELTCNNTTAFDITSVPTLPEITSTLKVGGGDPGAFFPALQTTLRQKSVLARGLNIFSLFKVVKRLNGARFIPQGFLTDQELFHCLKDPSQPQFTFNSGALAVVRFIHNNGKEENDFKDFPMQIKLPVPFTEEKRTYHLGAIVASSGGHAFAFVKRDGDKWYVADDQCITPIRIDQLPITKPAQKSPNIVGLSYSVIIPWFAFYYLIL